MAYTTADYVQQLKDKYKLSSNYQVHQFLEVSERAVSNWTKKRSTLDDVSAIIVAEKLQIDPSIIVTACHLERAERQGNEMVASVFRTMLKRLESAATTTAAAAVTFVMLGQIWPY